MKGESNNKHEPDYNYIIKMKKMHLSILALLLAVCGHAAPDNAGGQKLQSLVFDFRDGTQKEFLLADKPCLTFGEGKVNVEAGTTVASYDIASVAGYHFSDVLTAIDNTRKEQLRLRFTDNSSITVDGTAAKSASLYDTGGKQVAVQRVTDGRVTFSVAGLTGGVYIVKLSDGQSFKLLKK